MPSEEEEKQFVRAMHDLEEFTKLFVEKYPLLLKSGYCKIDVHSSVQHPFFPYEASLEIKEQK